jgi:hydrogenase maturation protease
MPDFFEQLQQCFRGRVCLMGLGNAEYGDDAFGVRLAETVSSRLSDSGKLPEDLSILIAGTSPERFIGRLHEGCFDSLVFLDAVELGEAPGSAVFLSSGEMIAAFPQVSTHKISLGTLAKWVESSAQIRAWLLGVQPESLKGAKITPPVQKAIDVLSDLFCEFRRLRGAGKLENPDSGN